MSFSGDPVCQHCQSNSVVRRGKRTTKTGVKQVYFCLDCGKHFVLSPLKGKAFSPKIVLEAITQYNLNHTLEEASKQINKRFKVKTSKTTIHNWLQEFNQVCNYDLREQAIKAFGKNVIASKLFTHQGLGYEFRYHKPKTEFLGWRHGSLKNFLKTLANDFPHKVFLNGQRCSQLKLSLGALKKEKHSHACNAVTAGGSGSHAEAWL